MTFLITHWKVIMVVLVILVSNYNTYEYVSRGYEQKLSEMNVEGLKSTLAQQQNELVKQKQIVDTLVEVNKDAEERNIQINNDLVDANESLGMLKQRLNSMSKGGKGGDSSSTIRSAANAATDRLVLSQLLTDCAERYKRMAETADRSRSAGLSCESQYNKIKEVLNEKRG